MIAAPGRTSGGLVPASVGGLQAALAQRDGSVRAGTGGMARGPQGMPSQTYAPPPPPVDGGGPSGPTPTNDPNAGRAPQPQQIGGISQSSIPGQTYSGTSTGSVPGGGGGTSSSAPPPPEMGLDLTGVEANMGSLAPSMAALSARGGDSGGSGGAYMALDKPSAGMNPMLGVRMRPPSIRTLQARAY